MSMQPQTAALRGRVALMAEGSPVALIQQLQTAFSDFREANEQRLTNRDTLLDEKINRLDDFMSTAQAALDAITVDLDALRINGPEGETTPRMSPEARAHADAFERYFRTGNGESELTNLAIAAGGPLSRIQAALSVGSADDGGHLAPIEWDRGITPERVEISPMRQYAGQQTVTGQGFSHLYDIRGTASGWVGETAARTETNSPQLKSYAFAFGELYANPAATQRILEDSEIDVAAWLESSIATEFARQEGVAFVSGDGVNKPRGVLTYDATTEGALAANLQHPLGPVAEVNSGNANTLTTNGIVDLQTRHPADRSGGAAFYANRLTIGVIRKFKDADENYIWQPSYQVGQPATLLGSPCRELSGMPNTAANAIPLIYGNLMMAYRIFDRRGIVVLRDPYTNKPYVMFYTTKRVGGGIWDPSWLRYQRIAA